MKHQVLFSLKNNEFINVVCCSRDWRVIGVIDALRVNFEFS